MKLGCKDCVYFHIERNTTNPVAIDMADGSVVSAFQCRRYAPKPLIGGSGTGWRDWEWPKVRPDDLCGEFKEI